MKTFLFDERDPIGRCVECAAWTNIAHHLHGRKWSDVCIWLCFDCHRYCHDHPEWAKKRGYMKRTVQDKTMKKAKKFKGCKHTKRYWSKAVGDFVCNYCGKAVGIK